MSLDLYNYYNIEYDCNSIDKLILLPNCAYWRAIKNDPNDFYPIDNCNVGSIYFTDLKYIKWSSHYGPYVRKVIINDDDLIYYECNGRYKIHSIELSDRECIKKYL